jgi:hypothetical protein
VLVTSASIVTGELSFTLNEIIKSLPPPPTPHAPTLGQVDSPTTALTTATSPTWIGDPI